MTIFRDGEWLRGYENGAEVERCRVVDTKSVVLAGELSVDAGAPHGTFLRMCREVLRYAGGCPLRIVVDYGPNMERLVRVYERLGGKPVGIVMEKH